MRRADPVLGQRALDDVAQIGRQVFGRRQIGSSASRALPCRTGSSERHERSAVASRAATCGLRFSIVSTVSAKKP